MNMVKAVRDWFRTCPLLDKTVRINVDYLSGKPLEYTIDTAPTVSVVARYMDGSSVRELDFVFASREAYGADALQNLANIGFFEELQGWIEQQNKGGNLPLLGENQCAESVTVSSGGYLFEQGTDSARYQIQCKLTYVQEE